MLDKIKRMFGVKEITEEVLPLYRGAKSKQEALILLKEALRRDESRRRRAMQDLEVFNQMEEELLEEGKQEMTENRRLMLARRIKEIRSKSGALNGRIENIYNRRIQVFTQHIESLQTAVEIESEPIPDAKTMEEMAIQARKMVEDLEKSSELAVGISMNPDTIRMDDEEQKIIQEMERRAEPEVEKEEPKVVKEAPKKEKPKEEPPAQEIIYEE
jgi:hypothetical protein